MDYMARGLGPRFDRWPTRTPGRSTLQGCARFSRVRARSKRSSSDVIHLCPVSRKAPASSRSRPGPSSRGNEKSAAMAAIPAARATLLTLMTLIAGGILCPPGLEARPLFERLRGRPLLRTPPVNDSHSNGDTPYVHTNGDDFQPGTSSDLIDMASTDLPDKGDPVLGVYYVSRKFNGKAFSDVVSARQEGPFLALATRAGRDFQLTLEAPFLTPSLSLASGFMPSLPGSLSSATLEVKYRVPVEVFGWRTVVGARSSSLKDRSHPLFTPGDWTRLNRIYVTFSKAFRRWQRIHLQFARTNIPQPEGLQFNEMLIVSLASESDLFRHEDTFIRWISELHLYDFKTSNYNHYGRLGPGMDTAFHTGLRLRNDVTEIDVTTRRILTAGFREFRVGFQKRF